MESIKEPHVKTLSREDFLSAIKAKETVYSVKALGGRQIVIRQISLAERDEMKSGSMRPGGIINDTDFVALTVLKGVVTPKLTPPDVAALREGSSGAVTEIASAIWKMSGVMTEEAAKNE